MNNLIFRIKRRVILIIDRYIRFFVSIIPRKKGLIVYGGALDLFIDNAKHLFLQNNENAPFDHCIQVWLTRNPKTYERIKQIGYSVEYSNTLKGWWIMMRAQFVIYDNEIREFSRYNLSEGAIRIELWHGLPLKFWGCIKMDDQDEYKPKSFFYEKYIRTHAHGDYTICTHHNQKKFFSAAFQIPIKNVFVSSYPRNRVLLMDENTREQYVHKYESEEYYSFYRSLKDNSYYKIVYMPTFRDNNPYYLNTAINDWQRINEVCKLTKTKLYLKVHRVTPLPDIKKYSNIEVLDNGMDIYPLLPRMDMLITDYSSIMFDFSLLKKPIVLYTYDISEYVHDSRKVTQNYHELRAKLTEVCCFEELINVVKISKDNIKDFPVEGYFDKSENIMEINEILNCI